MTRHRNLPDTASVAHKGESGRLSAPSALRNIDAILGVLKGLLPAQGNALEIASGTGEHVLRYGHAFPNIDWQPSDVDAERRASIRAWQLAKGSPNVYEPIELNATKSGWSGTHNGYDMILLANLLHLISHKHAKIVVTEVTDALLHGGICLFYGPYKRGTEFASQGDERFHQSLVNEDAAIGYKSFQQVQTWQSDGGLEPKLPIEMPSNNLILAAQKPG